MTTDDESTTGTSTETPAPRRSAYPDHTDLQRQSLEAADLRAEAAVLRARLDALQLGKRLTAPIQLSEIAAAAEAKDRERAGNRPEPEPEAQPEAQPEPDPAPARTPAFEPLRAPVWEVLGGPLAGAPDPHPNAPDSGLRDVQFADLSAPATPRRAPGLEPQRHEFMPFLALIVAIGLLILLFRPAGGPAPAPRTIGVTRTSLANLAARAATPPFAVSATTLTVHVQGELVAVREQLELAYASADAGPAGGPPPSALTLRLMPDDGAATTPLGPWPDVRSLAVSLGGTPVAAIPGDGSWAVQLPADGLTHELTLDYTLSGSIGPGDTFGLVAPMQVAGVVASTPVTVRTPDAEVIGMTCPWLAESRCSRADGEGRVAVVPAGVNPTVVIAVDRP